MHVWLKFRFSKKATKFETISHLIWCLLIDCFKFLWPFQNVRTLLVSCPSRTKILERYLTHTVHTTLATLGQVPITSQMQPLKFTSCSWFNSSLTFIFMHHFYILKAGLKVNSQMALSKLILVVKQCKYRYDKYVLDFRCLIVWDQLVSYSISW